MTQPMVRSTFQRRGRTMNPLAPRGRVTVRRVVQRRSSGQFTSWPAVGGVGPDLGDLRLGETQAPEEFAGCVAVGHAGGRHRDDHGQAEGVDGDVSPAAVDFRPCVVAAGLAADGRGRPPGTTDGVRRRQAGPGPSRWPGATPRPAPAAGPRPPTRRTSHAFSRITHCDEAPAVSGRGFGRGGERTGHRLPES